MGGHFHSSTHKTIEEAIITLGIAKDLFEKRHGLVIDYAKIERFNLPYPYELVIRFTK